MITLSRQRGFTLIEFILVTILMSIIAIAVSKIYSQALIVTQTEENMSDAIWQGQIAMQRIVRDLRLIRSANDITTMTSDNLVFTNILGNSINYNHSGSGTANPITINGDDLAYGILHLTLGYKTAANATAATAANLAYIVITINVTQNSSSYALNSVVYLRDLSS
jgi:prepilin-type N-terminal cleavage/methylation domain-containing protein